MRQFFHFVVFAVSGLTALAQGYIFPNGVTRENQSDFDYTFHVLQNTTNFDYTGFVLRPTSKTPATTLYTNTFSFGSLLDEGVRVFLVTSNQAISPQSIHAGSYTELMDSNIFTHNSSFYVALYTGYNPFEIINGSVRYTGIYTDPVFGWARLRNNRGVIELLDSALAFQSQGIFAGTQTLIPEPTTMSLFSLAGLSVLLNCRKQT